MPQKPLLRPDGRVAFPEYFEREWWGLSEVEDGHKWLKHVAPQLFSTSCPDRLGFYDPPASHKPMDLCDDVFHCKLPVLDLDSRFC
jgi:hypothetical protein